jgi:hypothetical protein
VRATALDGVSGVVATADGANVYGAAAGSDAVSMFGKEIAPVCSDTVVSVPPDTSVTVSLPCSDVNGTTLTRTLVTRPAKGRVSGINQSRATLTFSPSAGFAGEELIRFRASDGITDSNTASVRLIVSARPQGPRTSVLPKSARLRTGGWFSVRVKCPVTARGNCVGKLVVRTAATVTLPGKRGRVVPITTRKISIRPGRTVVYGVKLSKPLRKVMVRRGVLKVRAVVTARDRTGITVTVRRVIALRPKH